MLTADSFLQEIEQFIARTGMSASSFGRSAIGDPNLIGDLRQGRMPSLRTVGRVQAFIADHVKTSTTPSPERASA